jgi:aromatic-amino-acid transaminase
VSFFASVEMAPGDPILGLTETFVADTRVRARSIWAWVFTSTNRPHSVLRAVKEVEQALASNRKPRGYLPIDGLPAYNQLTQQLLFGPNRRCWRPVAWPPRKPSAAAVRCAWRPIC